MRKWLTWFFSEALLIGGPRLIDEEFFDSHLTEIMVIAALGLIVVLSWDWLKRITRKGWRGDWLTLEDAARFFRDEAQRLGLEDTVNMIDGFNKENKTENSVAAEFRGWLMVIMNEGHVEVWGAPVTGAKRVKLSLDLGRYFEESLESMLDRDVPWDVIEERGGAQYNDLLISKSGLKRFLRICKKDPLTRPVGRIEPRVDL